MKKLEILYEDEVMLACVKPAGVPSEGDKSNDEDMVSLIKNYIYDKGDSDEEPYVAPIHRLDKPVGGVMIFALTPEAATRLSDQMSSGEIIKYYQAILTGELPDDMGTLTDFLVKDSKNNMTKVVPKGTPNSKKAILDYEVLDVFETDEGIYSYVLVSLQTGRHHQIRVQMANKGCGIYGDRKYNSKAKAPKNMRDIGLYSSRIELIHPTTGEKKIFKSEPRGGAFDIIEMEDF